MAVSGKKKFSTNSSIKKKEDQEAFSLHKNPQYDGKVEAKRKRPKALKQILETIYSAPTQPQERKIKNKKGEMLSEKKDEAFNKFVNLENKYGLYKRLTTFVTINGSGIQQAHYCDITGLPALYKDPHTHLNYHGNAGAFDDEYFGKCTIDEKHLAVNVDELKQNNSIGVKLAQFIRSLPAQRVQQYLSLRGAGTII